MYVPVEVRLCNYCRDLYLVASKYCCNKWRDLVLHHLYPSDNAPKAPECSQANQDKMLQTGPLRKQPQLEPLDFPKLRGYK